MIKRVRNRVRQSRILVPLNEAVVEKTFDNRMYGMLDVLAKYADISSDHDYLVRVQHGIVHPEILVKSYTSKINNKIAQLTWNKPDESNLIPNVFAIGATFLYLTNLDNQVQRKKELVVVPHGGTYNNTGPSGFPVGERHKPILEYLEKQSAAKDILLYWHDFLDPQIRTKYEQLGARIHCAGFPGLPTTKLSKNNLGGQANFLENTRSILTQYNSLKIFEPTTTAVYAAFLGLNIMFDETRYLEQLDRETQVFNKSIGTTHRRNGHFQSETMCRLTQKDSKKVAGDLLGIQNKRSVADLATILNEFRTT